MCGLGFFSNGHKWTGLRYTKKKTKDNNKDACEQYIERHPDEQRVKGKGPSFSGDKI